MISLLTLCLTRPFTPCDPMTTLRRQNELMERFITPRNLPASTHKHLVNFFCSGGSRIPNACHWKGVDCCPFRHEMLALSMLVGRDAPELIVELDWLPPTLQYIHLSGVHHSNGWISERLPRNAEYLYMERCYVHSSCGDCKRNVNLQRLPSAMEELIVRSSWYHGQLMLTSLPPNIRIVWLERIGREKVFMDQENLPRSLDFLCVSRRTEGADVRGFDGSRIHYPLWWAKDAHLMLGKSKGYDFMLSLGSGARLRQPTLIE